LAAGRLLHELSRLRGFAQEVAELRPLLLPIFPAPIRRQRRKPVAKPHAT
jgi:hypothetical protein